VRPEADEARAVVSRREADDDPLAAAWDEMRVAGQADAFQQGEEISHPQRESAARRPVRLTHLGQLHLPAVAPGEENVRDRMTTTAQVPELREGASIWRRGALRWEVVVPAAALAAAVVAVWVTLEADFLAYPGWLAAQKADLVLGPRSSASTGSACGRRAGSAGS
jgi:hypothetical protein